MATHAIRQIFCGKDTTEALVIVHDEDTVGPLGGTELACFGDCDVLWDREGRTGLEGSDGALGGTSALAVRDAHLLPLGECGRDCAFARKLGLDFLTNGLWTEGC